MQEDIEYKANEEIIWILQDIFEETSISSINEVCVCVQEERM